MTEPKLKCPCGKRHGRDLRGATSHISEALTLQDQLWAPTPPLRLPDDFPFRPMAWQVTENPPTIRALADRRREYEQAVAIWDPINHHRRRVQAREAADRAMARTRQRG